MKEKFFVFKIWNILRPFHKDFYIQFLVNFCIQISKILLTLLLAEIINNLYTKNINFVVLWLLTYPIISFILNRAELFQKLHSLKKVEVKLHTFLENYSEKNIDSSDILKTKGEQAIKTLVNNYFNFILPSFTYLILIVLAIAYYSPFIAAWCLLKIAILIIWVKKFTSVHGVMLDQNETNWKKRSLNFLKFHTLTISYSLTHGHKRELLIIATRYLSLIIAVYLFLRGRIGLGSVYAVFSWTGDVFTSVETIVNKINETQRGIDNINSYLKKIEN